MCQSGYVGGYVTREMGINCLRQAHAEPPPFLQEDLPESIGVSDRRVKTMEENDNPGTPLECAHR